MSIPSSALQLDNMREGPSIRSSTFGKSNGSVPRDPRQRSAKERDVMGKQSWRDKSLSNTSFEEPKTPPRTRSSSRTQLGISRGNRTPHSFSNPLTPPSAASSTSRKSGGKEVLSAPLVNYAFAAGGIFTPPPTAKAPYPYLSGATQDLSPGFRSSSTQSRGHRLTLALSRSSSVPFSTSSSSSSYGSNGAVRRERKGNTTVPNTMSSTATAMAIASVAKLYGPVLPVRYGVPHRGGKRMEKKKTPPRRPPTRVRRGARRGTYPGMTVKWYRTRGRMETNRAGQMREKASGSSIPRSSSAVEEEGKREELDGDHERTQGDPQGKEEGLQESRKRNLRKRTHFTTHLLYSKLKGRQTYGVHDSSLVSPAGGFFSLLLGSLQGNVAERIQPFLSSSFLQETETTYPAKEEEMELLSQQFLPLARNLLSEFEEMAPKGERGGKEGKGSRDGEYKEKEMRSMLSVGSTSKMGERESMMFSSLIFAGLQEQKDRVQELEGEGKKDDASRGGRREAKHGGRGTDAFFPGTQKFMKTTGQPIVLKPHIHGPPPPPRPEGDDTPTPWRVSVSLSQRDWEDPAENSLKMTRRRLSVSSSSLSFQKPQRAAELFSTTPSLPFPSSDGSSGGGKESVGDKSQHPPSPFLLSGSLSPMGKRGPSMTSESKSSPGGVRRRGSQLCLSRRPSEATSEGGRGVPASRSPLPTQKGGPGEGEAREVLERGHSPPPRPILQKTEANFMEVVLSVPLSVPLSGDGEDLATKTREPESTPSISVGVPSGGAGNTSGVSSVASMPKSVEGEEFHTLRSAGDAVEKGNKCTEEEKKDHTVAKGEWKEKKTMEEKAQKKPLKASANCMTMTAEGKGKASHKEASGSTSQDPLGKKKEETNEKESEASRINTTDTTDTTRENTVEGTHEGGNQGRRKWWSVKAGKEEEKGALVGMAAADVPVDEMVAAQDENLAYGRYNRVKRKAIAGASVAVCVACMAFSVVASRAPKGGMDFF